jgi:hypothetical protein
MFFVRPRALPGLETYAIGEKKAQILDQSSSSPPGMKRVEVTEPTSAQRVRAGK